MEKLLEIQAELKCPKGSLNKFGNYKYRSAEQILESVKPLLKKHGSTLTLTDDIVQVGNKVFLKAIATLNTGDGIYQISGFAELGEHKGMSSEQCTGTASSYARKYALNGLFLIDETESDPDSKDNSKPKEKLDSKRFKDALMAINEGTIVNGKKLTKEFLIENFDLTTEQIEML